MPTLTLKQVPSELVERLRAEATRQRRSLNQQAIYYLEQASGIRRQSFTTALNEFFRTSGPTVEDAAEAFENLRIRDHGRDVDL